MGSPRARDDGLRRIHRLTRGVIAGGVVATAAFSAFVARSLPGHSASNAQLGTTGTTSTGDDDTAPTTDDPFATSPTTVPPSVPTSPGPSTGRSTATTTAPRAPSRVTPLVPPTRQPIRGTGRGSVTSGSS